MATRALSADAGRASSEIPEDLAVPSRRSILALVAGAGAVAAIGVPATAAIATDRPWDRALARYEQASAVAERYGAEVYDRVWHRISSDAGPIPSLTIEHTARNGQVAVYHINPRLSDGGHSYPFIRDAANTRIAEWNGWMARSKRAELNYGWDEISARCDALDVAEYEARKALMREPAPDMRALAYKLRLALQGEEMWENEREALRFDAQRALA